jgi:hypothetical protein
MTTMALPGRSDAASRNDPSGHRLDARQAEQSTASTVPPCKLLGVAAAGGREGGEANAPKGSEAPDRSCHDEVVEDRSRVKVGRVSLSILLLGDPDEPARPGSYGAAAASRR